MNPCFLHFRSFVYMLDEETVNIFFHLIMFISHIFGCSLSCLCYAIFYFLNMFSVCNIYSNSN